MPNLVSETSPEGVNHSTDDSVCLLQLSRQFSLIDRLCRSMTQSMAVDGDSTTSATGNSQGNSEDASKRVKARVNKKVPLFYFYFYTD